VAITHCKRKYKALFILIIMAKEKLISYMVEANDPQECWIMLQDLYANKNATSIMYL
jgi:hypothetical protein